MNQAHQNRAINRRTFLKIGAIGSAAAATGWGAEAQETEGEIRYRNLGRTGLKVAVIGVGAMRTTEPAVLQAAFDRGVNYLDTAHCYMGGNNERIVGKALKGYREKVFVATKLHLGTKEAMIQSVEDSLVSLGTDYVDVLQIHNLKNPEPVMDSVAREALAQLKKDGKARFCGVTTHSNEIAVLDALTNDPDKFFDMVLVVYNYKSSDEHKAAIERVAKTGVGVVAMKTQQGGYEVKELEGVSPHQAALKWVLDDTNVALAVPGMVDLAQVNENTPVMRMKLTTADLRILERYDRATAPYYCHMCGECTPSCPAGVEIDTINRSLMYAQGYRDVALARATYAGIPAGRRAATCLDCSQCIARCTKGLNIPAKMKQARALLA